METESHREDIPGQWQCLAVGKNNVKVFTTRDGWKACGHCLKFILDSQGEKQVWTMRDQLLWRKEEIRVR